MPEFNSYNDVLRGSCQDGIVQQLRAEIERLKLELSRTSAFDWTNQGNILRRYCEGSTVADLQPAIESALRYMVKQDAEIERLKLELACAIANERIATEQWELVRTQQRNKEVVDADQTARG